MTYVLGAGSSELCCLEYGAVSGPRHPVNALVAEVP